MEGGCYLVASGSVKGREQAASKQIFFLFLFIFFQEWVFKEKKGESMLGLVAKS